MIQPKTKKDDRHRSQQVPYYVGKPKILYPILIYIRAINLATYFCKDEEKRERDEVNPAHRSKLENPVFVEKNILHKHPSFICSISRLLTARVTCAGAGVDSAWEQENPGIAAESHLPVARWAGWHN
jgi:hypothetical protein